MDRRSFLAAMAALGGAAVAGVGLSEAFAAIPPAVEVRTRFWIGGMEFPLRSLSSQQERYEHFTYHDDFVQCECGPRRVRVVLDGWHHIQPDGVEGLRVEAAGYSVSGSARTEDVGFEEVYCPISRVRQQTTVELTLVGELVFEFTAES